LAVSRWPFVGFLILACAGCGLLNREPTVLIRPGCSIRVLDNETGQPLAGIHITLVTLYGNTDTVGHWSYVTDPDGNVVIPSARVTLRHETGAGRREDLYVYIASFEGNNYKYYSQRITGGTNTVLLSREYMLAQRNSLQSSSCKVQSSN
jgi:5-hydroxyisourate hydrolase-like protein (transthyretin family)